MTKGTLADLQESVQDRTAFGVLGDYLIVGHAFLTFMESASPTRVVSPSCQSPPDVYHS